MSDRPMSDRRDVYLTNYPDAACCSRLRRDKTLDVPAPSRRGANYELIFRLRGKLGDVHHVYPVIAVAISTLFCGLAFQDGISGQTKLPRHRPFLLLTMDEEYLTIRGPIS